MTNATYNFGRRSSGLFLGLDGPGLVLGAIVVTIAFVGLLTLGLLAAIAIGIFGALILWVPTPTGEPLRALATRYIRWGWRALRGKATSTPTTGFSEEPLSLSIPPWGDIDITQAVDGRAIAKMGHEYLGAWYIRGGMDFALRADDDKEVSLLHWGSCLDQLAAVRSLRRLQWLLVVYPDRASEPSQWLTTHARISDDDVAADYISLLSRLGGSARRRDIILVAVVAPTKPSPLAAAAELRGVDRLLDGANLFPTALSPSQLETALRHAADPSLAPKDQLRAVRGLDIVPTLPMWELELPDSYTVSGQQHATLAISELPRIPAPGDWLWPLLAASIPTASRFAISCHLTPVPQWRAMRMAESAVATAESEMRRRQRAGFIPRSRDRLAAEAHARREEEVAAGHSTWHTRLTITLSAPSPSLLRQATDDAIAAARRARCDAHTLSGGHRDGWRASLPLAITPAVERFTATTRHLRSLFPCQVATGNFGGGGVALGVDALSFTPFCYDPWAYYQQQLLTNPSLAVFGAVGRGKSTFVKALLLRSCGVFGRRVWILDPKGEYAPLGQALNLPIISLHPGGDVRINPLDVMAGTTEADAAKARSGLLKALGEAMLGRPLTPEEDAGLLAACHALPPDPILNDVVKLLLQPTPAQVEALATTPEAHAAGVREVALRLSELVNGRLAGMFDSHSTLQLSPQGGVIDLSAAWSEPATRAPILAASLSWLTTALAQGSGHPTYVVVDEAWQVLERGIDFLRATAKLARSLGISLLLIMHHPADLSAAGDEGSAVARRAEALLSDVGTVVVFGDPTPIPPAVASALDLSERETELIKQFERGRCLVAIGSRHQLVDVVLSERESRLTDTDTTMAQAV